MLFFGGALGVLFLFLWAYCILDVIATDEILIQHLPKFAWLIIVIIVPEVGSLAWLVLGRPIGQGLRPGGARQTPNPYAGRAGPTRRRPIGPEDSPDYISKIESGQSERLKKWEEDLARREEELRRKSEEQD